MPLSLLINIILIPVSYAHFAYDIIAKTYDCIIMIYSLLSTISNALFFTILSLFFYVFWKCFSFMYCRSDFYCLKFSFCIKIIGFIILSHNLILVSFYSALLWLKNRKAMCTHALVVKHTYSEAICTYQFYPGASY